MTAVLATHFATSSLNIASQRVGSSWPWYIIRAAGFAASGLLVLLMLSGIGQVTGLTYRFIEPIKAWALHKAMALALCAAIVIHIGMLLLDHFVSFNIFQILIPFVSHYNNGTSFAGLALGGLAVTFGILAMYGVAVIVLSSLGWIDTRQKTWRWLHYVSYLVMLFVLLHGLFVGTDLKYGLFRAAWLGLGFLVVLGILSRLRRVGSLKKTKD